MSGFSGLAVLVLVQQSSIMVFVISPALGHILDCEAAEHSLAACARRKGESGDVETAKHAGLDGLLEREGLDRAIKNARSIIGVTLHAWTSLIFVSSHLNRWCELHFVLILRMF